MNKRKRVALAYHQQTAGLNYGNVVAKRIIDEFPDGFNDEVGQKITAIVEGALTHVTDILVSNNVPEKFIEPFRSGFYIAVRNSFATKADDCRSRAMQDFAA